MEASLVEKLYGELRALAQSYFRGQPGGVTLSPTALVHEVWLRLAKGEPVFNDRAHFFAIAATAMRQILTDQARRRRAAKRGGAGRERVTLSGVPAWDSPVDIVAIDELLVKLKALDERLGRLAELRFFAGLTQEEAAEALGVSLRTVQGDWRKAKAWLLAELGKNDSS